MKILHFSFTKKTITFLLSLRIIVSVYSMEQTITVPERQSSNIQCPSNASITVLSAVYKPLYCNCINATYNVNNCSKNVTNFIQNLCDKKNYCVVRSNNDNFGDPCIGMSKDTIITYTCHLENSAFVPDVENKFTETALNSIYDEYVVSFVIFLNGITNPSVISIEDKNSTYVLMFDINDGSLQISTINKNIYNVKITPSTSSLIVITQCFINNTYIITVAVNETVYFSDIITNPMVLSDSIVYTFVNCYYNSPCNVGFIKNLSLYSKTQVIWSHWSEWSFCDTHCITTRTRNCNNNQWLNCTGNSKEAETCSSLDKDFWTPWNIWSYCNAFFGLINRTRECCVLDTLDLCYDDKSQVIEYSVFWAQWSDWSHCNSSNGYTIRTKECIDLITLEWFYVNQSKLLVYTALWAQFNNNSSRDTFNEILNKSSMCKIKCDGHNFELTNCIVFWTQWSIWTSCNASLGYMSRTRECNASDAMNQCLGNKTEVKECYVFWSPWSKWSICNQTSGFMNRSRICNVSNPTNLCNGKNFDVIECYAFWAQWSIWTSCNISHGFMNRSRECNTSTASSQCFGDNTEAKKCFEYWTQWSNWSRCNNSYGFMNRTRMCNVSNDFDWCFENSLEVKDCFAFWTPWSNWSICNATNGFMNRSRRCNFSNLLGFCDGYNFEVIKCYAFWSQWSVWSSCSGTYGFMNKTRECNVSHATNQCYGQNISLIKCFEKWASWSECSVTCGMGSRSRVSLASNDSIIMEESCTQVNCPVNGMWGEWDKTYCSKTCGNGLIAYRRSCNNPPPLYNGCDCMGVNNSTEECNTDIICPVNGNWSLWSSWSLCSQPCGGGVKTRFRSCSNPMPSFGGLDCFGSVGEFEYCAWHKCKSVGLNLAVNFIDKVYTDPSSIVTSIPSIKLRKNILDEIAKLYSDYNVNVTFNVVIHSIKHQP
ncbi:A disintegrin and metalloproteinase with thrombospondin motifs adt-1-like isoform X5 [Hydra vulgaris]|uniref:A disintegrin and metalloproteinase with thrombospondin motifs adt-1-like isoform X5 n=1 Tax=Hydra vulgaris TaxID=6087 RepID=A0ABM4BWX4_HYDVU